jgi:hypothetical protein
MNKARTHKNNGSAPYIINIIFYKRRKKEMYNIVGYSENDAVIKECVVDTKAEMSELFGKISTTTLCLEDMKYYIKDRKGEWREVA